MAPQGCLRFDGGRCPRAEGAAELSVDDSDDSLTHDALGMTEVRPASEASRKLMVDHVARRAAHRRAATVDNVRHPRLHRPRLLSTHDSPDDPVLQRTHISSRCPCTPCAAP